MPPTAWALLAGEMMSDTTPTDVGGMVPPPNPPSTLSARNTSMLGAKADPRSLAGKPFAGFCATQNRRIPV